MQIQTENKSLSDLNKLIDNKIHSLNSFNGSSMRSANQRMIDALEQPEILPLLPYIWMTNELHLLFADTGIGKSLLAVQISNALSNCVKLLNFNAPQFSRKIMFYDFEMTDRQFYKRYSDERGNIYAFSDNFLIDNVDFVELMTENPNKSVMELIFSRIERDLETHSPDILVIDNITFLNAQNTQETQTALDIMRRLNEIKKNTGISILVLAHTPKRSLYAPLNINDLAGSKMLSNFADSVSAIGKSSIDGQLRYIKQIKPSRSSELVYDGQNVITCALTKTDCFLGFEFIRFSHEKEHLLEPDEKKRDEDKQWVLSLLESGKSFREIERETGIPKSTVQRWKKEMSHMSQSSNDGTVGQTGQ